MESPKRKSVIEIHYKELWDTYLKALDDFIASQGTEFQASSESRHVTGNEHQVKLCHTCLYESNSWNDAPCRICKNFSMWEQSV